MNIGITHNPPDVLPHEKHTFNMTGNALAGTLAHIGKCNYFIRISLR